MVVEMEVLEMLIQKAGFGHTKQKILCNSTSTSKQGLPAIPSGQEIFLVGLPKPVWSRCFSLFLTRGDQLNILALSAPADAAQCLFLPVLAQHGVSQAHWLSVAITTLGRGGRPGGAVVGPGGEEEVEQSGATQSPVSPVPGRMIRRQVATGKEEAAARVEVMWKQQNQLLRISRVWPQILLKLKEEKTGAEKWKEKIKR